MERIVYIIDDQAFSRRVNKKVMRQAYQNAKIIPLKRFKNLFNIFLRVKEEGQYNKKIDLFLNAGSTCNYFLKKIEMLELDTSIDINIYLLYSHKMTIEGLVTNQKVKKIIKKPLTVEKLSSAVLDLSHLS